MVRLGLREGEGAESAGDLRDGWSFTELSVDSPAAIDVKDCSPGADGAKSLFDLLRVGSCCSVDRRDSALEISGPVRVDGALRDSLSLETHAATRFRSLPLTMPREARSDGSSFEREARSETPAAFSAAV